MKDQVIELLRLDKVVSTAITDSTNSNCQLQELIRDQLKNTFDKIMISALGVFDKQVVSDGQTQYTLKLSHDLGLVRLSLADASNYTIFGWHIDWEPDYPTFSCGFNVLPITIGANTNFAKFVEQVVRSIGKYIV